MKKIFITLLVTIISSSGILWAQKGSSKLSKDQNQKLIKNNFAADATMLFVENKGQLKDQFNNTREDIDFKIKGNGVNVFIGSSKVHYQWSKTIKNEKAEVEKVETYRMDVELLGANTNAKVVTQEKQNYFEQYFLNNGATKAETYKQVIYKDVYPNIDWVFYFNNENKLEHDFIIKPGGKVTDIKVKYGGSNQLKINEDGSLTATTPMGTVTEAAPYSYEKGSNKQIPSSFNIEGSAVTFNTMPYKGTLIIDPSVEWATYYGGIDTTGYMGVLDQLVIRTDALNNVYIAGTASEGYDNVVTSGAFQSTIITASGSTLQYPDFNNFLVKFNSSGQRLWATYYGKSVNPIGTGLAIDANSNVYLAGATLADPSLVTTGAHQTTFGGGVDKRDAYIVKFDGTGQRLWGTYLGGVEEDAALALSCDANGDVYMVGNTNSTSGIASANAHQSTMTGSRSFFLAKFNTTGQRVWSTYYGEHLPALYGWASDMVVTNDDDGSVYLASNLWIYPTTVPTPTNFVTPNGFQTVHGGKCDVILAKFNSSGVHQWATWYGGAENDLITREGLAADKWGNVYLSGRTHSTSGIATPGAHQTTFGGGVSAWGDPVHWGGDAFLVKFDKNGVRLWGTYYGGTEGENEFGYGGVGCDIFGNVYISGQSASSTNIATPGSLQSFKLAYDQGYLAKFDGSGVRKWGTYFGNIAEGRIECIATNDSGQIFIAGFFNDYANLSTPGAHQIINGSVFLAKLDDCSDIIEAVDTINGNVIVCSGSMNTFSVNPLAGASNYQWILPSGWLGSSDSSSIDLEIIGSSAQLGVVAIFNCGVSDTTWLNVTVNSAPVPVITVNGNVLSTGSFATYQWRKDNIDIPGANAATYEATTQGDYTVFVTGSNGCSGISNVVNHLPTSVNGASWEGQIKIFPKPATTSVNIEMPVTGMYTLTTVEGKQIQSGKLAASLNTIDVKSYADGIYFLNLYTKNGELIKTEKLIKK